MINKQNINIAEEANKIWKIANILRGPWSREEYKDVIIPFLILRRFECIASYNKDKVQKILNKWIKEHPEEEERSKLNEKRITDKLKIECGEFYLIWNSSIKTWKDITNSNKNSTDELLEYINGFPEVIRNIFILGTEGKKNEDEKNFNIEKILKALAKHKLYVAIMNAFLEFDLSPIQISSQHMGYIFEELIRKFSENKTAGEHYTPREVIKLLSGLAICDQTFQDSEILNIGDFACGTGGILSSVYDLINESVGKNKNIKINLWGQEVNPLSYSFCVADMLIKGQDPERITPLSTLEFDKTNGIKFRFIIENPPFGESWGGKGREAESLAIENGIRFPIKNIGKSDIQTFFHMDAISKLKENGKAIIISNGSPLFSGDVDSGENKFRLKYLDKLECIIKLPTELFYNTGINIYVWVYNNAKSIKLKDKIQIIDASKLSIRLSKGLGMKRNKITDEQIKQIIDLYKNKTESNISLIKSFDDFKTEKWEILCKYQRSFILNDDNIDVLKTEYTFDQDEFDTLTKKGTGRTKKEDSALKNIIELKNNQEFYNSIFESLIKNRSETKYNERKKFEDFIISCDSNLKLKEWKSLLKNIVDTCSFFDENAKVEDKAYDNKRKDSEYIPLNIKPKDYFDKEVKPFLANSELGADLGTQIEFNFNKHFYEPIVLRKSKDIAKDILEIDKEIRKLEEELYE